MKASMNFKGLVTNFWLRHPEQSVFHVFLSMDSGTGSLCGRSPVITERNKMDLPGDKSVCCLHCFVRLYGFDPYEIPRAR